MTADSKRDDRKGSKAQKATKVRAERKAKAWRAEA